ncbi:MAG: hypothetical protein Q8O74_00290 [bacterium]|nr:hypothetical protein [bacterium]
MPDYPSASAKALALEEGMQEAEAEESMEGTDFSVANQRWSTQNDEVCRFLQKFRNKLKQEWPLNRNIPLPVKYSTTLL